MYHPSGNLHLQRSPLQDPYNDFSYRERPFDSSRLHEGGVLQSRYPQQTDGRWQPSSFHDNQRTYQTQFVPSSREFDASYHRPPDRYFSPPDQVFYDGRQPVGEGPRSYAPDTRYRSAEVPYGQRQGSGTATPYEPRTEGSYREATTHMEGREEPLIRVDMEDNTMMVGRLGTMAIRDHRNLSHREMKGTSVEEMKLLLTRYGVLFKVMLYVDDNRDLTFRQRRDPLKRR